MKHYLLKQFPNVSDNIPLNRKFVQSNLSSQKVPDRFTKNFGNERKENAISQTAHIMFADNPDSIPDMGTLYVLDLEVKMLCD